MAPLIISTFYMAVTYHIGALQPYRCSVHSCRGLELWPHSLSPHFIMVCGQIHTPATLPNYVHIHVMNTKFLASL